MGISHSCVPKTNRRTVEKAYVDHSTNKVSYEYYVKGKCKCGKYVEKKLEKDRTSKVKKQPDILIQRIFDFPIEMFDFGGKGDPFVTYRVYRWSGPHTNMKKQLYNYHELASSSSIRPICKPEFEPINAIDRCALEHDVCYLRAGDDYEKRRSCDQELLNKMDRLIQNGDKLSTSELANARFIKFVYS
jgi:hypothetical protein